MKQVEPGRAEANCRQGVPRTAERLLSTYIDAWPAERLACMGPYIAIRYKHEKQPLTDISHHDILRLLTSLPAGMATDGHGR